MLPEVETDELVVVMATVDGEVTDPNPDVVPGPPLEVALPPKAEPVVEEVKAAGAAELWLKMELLPPPSPGALPDI